MHARMILSCVAILGALTPSAVAAQPAKPGASPQAAPGVPPDEQEKAAARAAADRGQQLYDAARYAEAIAAFQEADKTFHAPTFVLMIARAQDRLGKLRDARATYEQILAERLAHYAPRPFFEAQASARKELDALVPRIPSAQVFVAGAPTKGARLMIDGAAVAIGQPISLDPGEHTLVASAPGRIAVTQKITLQAGVKAQHTLDLSPPPPKPPAPPPAAKPVNAAPSTAEEPAPPTAGAPEVASGSRGYLVPSLVAFGVAGVGLAVGAFTGSTVLARVSALERACPDHKCHDDTEDTYDSAHTLATVSTVGFVVGGVAAAAGVTLLLWPRADEPATQVGLTVTPGGVSLKGGF